MDRQTIRLVDAPGGLFRPGAQIGNNIFTKNALLNNPIRHRNLFVKKNRGNSEQKQSTIQSFLLNKVLHTPQNTTLSTSYSQSYEFVNAEETFYISIFWQVRGPTFLWLPDRVTFLSLRFSKLTFHTIMPITVWLLTTWTGSCSNISLNKLRNTQLYFVHLCGLYIRHLLWQ